VAAIGLGIASVTGAVASPEDEIARLNRVRANLFEDLVKSRAEAASARAELEAAVKARDAAEAELARLKQQAVSAKPANRLPSTEAKAEPQPRAPKTAPPAVRRQSARAVAPGETGSLQRTAMTGAQQRVRRSSPTRRTVTRQTDQVPRPPVARAQGLPSVLRLQDPQ
jgi:chromosome segregation ATPase